MAFTAQIFMKLVFARWDYTKGFYVEFHLLVKKRRLLVEVHLHLSHCINFREIHACSINFCKIIHTECIRIV
jgi:hypothetical protein